MDGNVLVGADAGGFEGFGGQLLVLIGDHVHAEGEFVDVGTLAAQIENADFGIGHTAVEAGLGIWLWEDSDLAVFLNDREEGSWEACAACIVSCPQKAQSAESREVHSPCSCSSDSILLDDVPSR